jgi:hypothetical protein
MICCLLVFAIGLFTGSLHHDHPHGTLAAHHQCPACASQLNAVSDLPPLATCPAVTDAATAVPVCNIVFVPTVFDLSSASRAPPATPA